MAGFHSPNHTQVPNELLDIHLRNMDKAELKVILCIIRQTLGWHRNTVRFSLGNIVRITGLSWNSVMTGAENAERRGLIRRVIDSSPAEWEIVWEDTPSEIEGAMIEVPQPLREAPSTIEGLNPQPLRDLKERKKERKKEEGPPATYPPIGTPGSLQLFERIWVETTGMPSFMGASKEKDIERIEAVFCRNGRDCQKTIDELRLYFTAWVNTVSQKTNRKYSRTNTGWLDWAVAGEVNGSREVTQEDRMARIMQELGGAQ